MDNIETIITATFDQTANIYNEQMNTFYPTIGSRGINEANQILIFLSSFRAIQPAENIATWTEMPFVNEAKGRSRLDGLAWLMQENSLILIEAKRIKQGKTIGKLNTEKAKEEIIRDAKRMSDKNRIKFSFQRDVINSKTRIYRVMLGDIWINKDPKMRESMKGWLNGNIFPSDWKRGTFLSKKIVFPDSDDSYYLLLAMHPCPIIFDDI